MDSSASTVTRRLNRNPEKLWDELTSDDGFEQWMGPGSTIDARPGGRLVAADPESGQPKIGRVLDVEPGRRLHWVWRPLGVDRAAASTEVELVIEPGGLDDGRDGDGSTVGPPSTVVTVTERRSQFPVAGFGVGPATACVAVAVA